MQSRWYEIRIEGTLGPEWAQRFDGMDIRQEGETRTVLAGNVVDQAALHGLLVRIRDLNLVLLSINAVSPPQNSSARRETQGE